MKRRGYDIGRVVDLIFEYWLGRMKDSELEEYRHMKETTGLDKYAREFEDREWIKNALEEPDIFETDKAYRRFWSMTAGKRSIGRLRWRWVASLLIPLLVGGGVGLFVWCCYLCDEEHDRQVKHRHGKHLPALLTVRLQRSKNRHS